MNMIEAWGSVEVEFLELTARLQVQLSFESSLPEGYKVTEQAV
jgi:hypothetical protein